MSSDGEDFRVRPGRVRDGGSASGRKARSLAAQVRRAAARAGYARRVPGRGGKRGTGYRGRGRSAALGARFPANGRRVVIKARVVRHKGARFRAAPLARHIAYLERDGVTRDGRDANLFDARSEQADGDAFAARCEDDRHHFRFIVSPEDAGEMADLRAFTREVMADMAKDLDTELDWVAVDHWNTDNPHIHVLVRGRASDGADLVIDRDYIGQGMRARAEERVTIELGPRSEREIQASLEREVEADRWTTLDRRLQQMADDGGGVVDLRPGGRDPDPDGCRLMLGRAVKLERLGLAERIDPACWTLKPGLEQMLRDLSIRTDIIKTMHRAMAAGERAPDLASFALHGEAPTEPIIGRLVERGLHDELAGTAYAVIDGADGRTHHVRFDDIDMTGDAKPGAIVELRNWADARGNTRLSIASRSDLPLDLQVTAPGATWLDRQLVAREPVATGGGFGRDIREAMEARAEHLVGEGLARRQGDRLSFTKGMIDTLKAGELEAAVERIAERTGLPHRPSAAGEHVSGVFRERVTLASGRFAMIDDGLGFQLVPWRPALDQHLGRHVTGTMSPGGGVDWNLGRSRGLGL
jgi:type IV secretory pathway VirD2 relaxase